VKSLTDRRYWPLLASLLFLNVCIIGCLILLLLGKVAL